MGNRARSAAGDPRSPKLSAQSDETGNEIALMTASLYVLPCAQVAIDRMLAVAAR
jgi:hypothetical protein